MTMAIIHWKLEGVLGHGAPMSLSSAQAWVKRLNEQFGTGTHWWELVED